MKIEITEIIKCIIEHGSNMEYEEKEIAIAILGLKDKWPNLTLDEQKEIEATAYSIYLLDSDVDVNGLLDDVEFPSCLELSPQEEVFNFDEDTEEEYDNINYTNYKREKQKEEYRIKRFINRFRFKRNN